MEHSIYGKHVIVDAYEVDFDILNNEHLLKDLLVKAATQCGANVLGVQSNKFNPNGVTVLCLLSESHVSIHTYPEQGFAALDCYTCGETIEPEIAMAIIIDEILPKKYFMRKAERGIHEMIKIVL
jgi:S-adenosylmethionine decarboxylase